MRVLDQEVDCTDDDLPFARTALGHVQFTWQRGTIRALAGGVGLTTDVRVWDWYLILDDGFEPDDPQNLLRDGRAFYSLEEAVDDANRTLYNLVQRAVRYEMSR